MSIELTVADAAKLSILASGIRLADSTRAEFLRLGDGSMTPADYASTSGLILCLPDDVWVNAPFDAHNPNFVSAPEFTLTFDDGQFTLHSHHTQLPVGVWVPPKYHGTTNDEGRPLNHFVVTHGDRARVSPVQGCSMSCKFCDIPYERTPYGLKPTEACLDAVGVAMADELQPAHHILISGGTPRAIDVGALAAFYEALLTRLAGVDVDIMMAPVPGLFDLTRLTKLGVRELSINLEVYNTDRAQELMPQKHQQGRDNYLDFIERVVATGTIGVRSMLMVGLEPMTDTLAGVRALVERGATPVLSPFRPDPLTPLRDHQPPSPAVLADVLLRATDIACDAGIELGPDCPPCTHNTLTLHRTKTYSHPLPHLI